MQNALQHDPRHERTNDAKNEVVEVFTGDSLEQAMAHAVASLGPDLTVRRARRVRKGVGGLVGKDRYEVVAVPNHKESSDVLGNAFEALLNQAEDAEAATRPSALPLPRPSVIAFPDVELVPVRPPAPIPPPRARRTAAPRPRAASPAPRALPAPLPAAASGWSRKALTDLGLPRRVLAELPAKDPRTDLAWIAALTKALARHLPAPATAGAEHPVVVDGYGVEGVVALLAAAAKGLTPGTITVGERTAPATATELALAVRTALVGCGR